MNNFQILCFRHNIGSGYTTVRPDGSYWSADHPNDHTPLPDVGATLHYMLHEWKERESEWIEIYSIQDSSGTIYTIGDKIKSFDEVTYITGFDVTNPWIGGFGVCHGKETSGVEYVTKYPIDYANV